jgi:hypothetical protein
MYIVQYENLHVGLLNGKAILTEVTAMYNMYSKKSQLFFTVGRLSYEASNKFRT